MNNLILSDVCDTLIDLNSTYDYIKFLYTHNYGNKFLGYLLNNRFFSAFSYYYQKITGYDLQRKLTPIFFKGMRKKNLTKINNTFRKFYISNKTNILDKIISYKEKGNKVILVSASINPPIDMLGNYLGVDYFSSILEEVKGIYTGKIINDLLRNKESLLTSDKLKIKEYDNVIFYTDNLSDIGFIKEIQNQTKSYKFYLITKTDRLKEKRKKLLDSYKISNYEFIS